MKTIFEFHDYKAYLRQILGDQGRRTGKKGELAKAVGCQTAFVSQVLNGHQHFSLEQSYKINDFLNHPTTDAHFFLLLVQMNRAGTRELKKYFERQIDEIIEKRNLIKNRVTENKKISFEDESKYYSSWKYIAVHMSVSVPEYQTKETLSNYLSLSIREVSEILEFLVSIGLVAERNERYTMAPTHVHIGHDSNNILKHHTNWRLQGLRQIEKNNPKDVHYSVVYSLSKSDADILLKKILDLIEQNLRIVAPSQEEVVYCNTIDFFEIKN